MSGRPNTDNVAHLRALLSERRLLIAEIIELQKKEKRLAEADRERHEVEKAIMKVLESMDCSSPGNAGWESRIMTLLDYVDQQANGQL